MANHYSYSKDRDLMMEAYASVSGNVPATASTAMPRLLNERAGTPKVGSEFDGGTVIDIGAEEDGVIEIAVEKGDKLEMLYYNTATGEATPAEDAEGPDWDGKRTQDIPVEIKDEVQAKVLEIAGKPLGELSMTEYEAAQKQAHEFFKSEGKELHAKHLEQSLDFLGGARETVTTALDKATAEDAEDSPIQAAVNAVNAIANGDTGAVGAFTAAVDETAATLQGNDRVAAHEDLRDYINGSLQGSEVAEDLQDYLSAKLGRSEDAEGFDMLDVHHFVDQNDITAAIKEFGTEAIKQYIDFMDEQMDAAPEDSE